MDKRGDNVNHSGGIPTRLRDIKRLPIDISKDSLMDPINIPNKFKLFQASSINGSDYSSGGVGGGNLNLSLSYTIMNGVRLSLRSQDGRIRLSHESNRYSTPITASLTSIENIRGTREICTGINIPNLYSKISVIKPNNNANKNNVKNINNNNNNQRDNNGIRNNNNKSKDNDNDREYTNNDNQYGVIQIGLGMGIRAIMDSGSPRPKPYLTPKFTYVGRLGWMQLDTPLNKRNNLVKLKHHFFFSVKGNTILSSFEVSSSRVDRSIKRYAPKSLVDTLLFDNDTASAPTPSSINRVKDSIHYKLVHVASSTEVGIRRIRKMHGGSKWQLEFGLKHSIEQSIFIQCLFTHTIGEKTNFNVSFGLNL